MEITKNREGQELTVLIHGNIDTNTSGEIEKLIVNELEGVEHLILDLSEVSYISSSGLRLFMILYKKLADQGGVTLTNVNDFILDILEMTGFSNILDIQ